MHRTRLSSSSRITRPNRFFLTFLTSIPTPHIWPRRTVHYADKPWSEEQKTYAAMISYLDDCVGKLMQTLKDEGLEKDTVVFFASDNGARSKAAYTAVVEFFDSNGPLRGYKRDMYEGGIRVPMIVRWPDKVPKNKVDDTPLVLCRLPAHGSSSRRSTPRQKTSTALISFLHYSVKTRKYPTGSSTGNSSSGDSSRPFAGATTRPFVSSRESP